MNKVKLLILSIIFSLNFIGCSVLSGLLIGGSGVIGGRDTLYIYRGNNDTIFYFRTDTIIKNNVDTIYNLRIDSIYFFHNDTVFNITYDTIFCSLLLFLDSLKWNNLETNYNDSLVHKVYGLLNYDNIETEKETILLKYNNIIFEVYRKEYNLITN